MKKVIFAAILLISLVAACSSDDEDSVERTYVNPTVTTTDSSYTFELPVIFHVLYQDQSDANQYIPYKRLANILEYVNNIYKGGVYGESENVHLKFVLATTDENGNTLSYPGVEYVRYSGTYPIDPYEFMNDNSGSKLKYIWDPNQYINVMMYNFKQESSDEVVLGISHLPFTVKGSHQLQGLNEVTESRLTKSNLKFPYCSSINSTYANLREDGEGYYQSNRYTEPDADHQTIYSADIVVTVAHELGHYLGLLHAFTESGSSDGQTSVEPVDSCGDTDYCSDTYSYNRYEYTNTYLKSLSSEDSKNARMLLRRQSCDGIEYMSANIMDYSWTLGYKISKEQKARIRNVLYYSPLIPGPKVSTGTTTRASADGKPLDLKIMTIK